MPMLRNSELDTFNYSLFQFFLSILVLLTAVLLARAYHNSESTSLAYNNLKQH